MYSYELSVDKMNAPKPFKPLNGKKIVKIISGGNSFIALERTKKLVKDWTTVDVVQWCNEEGF